MGFKDAVGAICYGGMVVCVITSTIALMAVTSYQCNEVNPWLSYQPGPAGELGDLLYSMPILSGLAFGFLVVALVLEMLGINKLVVLILQIIGAVCFVGAFISEAIWLGFTDDWTNYNRVTKYQFGYSLKEMYLGREQSEDPAKYNSAYMKYISDFLTYANDHPDVSSPKKPSDAAVPEWGRIPTLKLYAFKNVAMSGGVFDDVDELLAKLENTMKLKLPDFSIPVCYFENGDKAQKFEDAVDCLGKWSAGKIKKYYETTYENEKKTDEEDQKFQKEHEEAIKGGQENLYNFYAKYSKKVASRYRDTEIYFRRMDTAPQYITDQYVSYLFHSFNIGLMTLAIIFTVLYFVFRCLGVARVSGD